MIRAGVAGQSVRVVEACSPIDRHEAEIDAETGAFVVVTPIDETMTMTLVARAADGTVLEEMSYQLPPADWDLDEPDPEADQR